MPQTRRAVVTRPPRPLSVTLVTALHSTLAFACLVAAAIILILMSGAPNPQDLILIGAFSVAVLLFYAVYSLFLAAANLAGKRWAWTAANLTALFLVIGASIAVLFSLVVILTHPLDQPSLFWESRDARMAVLAALCLGALMVILVLTLRAYHRPAARAYFGVA